MTPAEAEALATRVLTAIGQYADLARRNGYEPQDNHAADRERVGSDLVGLWHHAETNSIGVECACKAPWPCPDASRYARGLLRTAALYGVTP